MDNNAKKDQSMLQSVNITTHLVSMKKNKSNKASWKGKQWVDPMMFH